MSQERDKVEIGFTDHALDCPSPVEVRGDPPWCSGSVLEAVSNGTQRDPIPGPSVDTELLPEDGGDAVV